MVLFASACGYQSFCDRHHHGVFVLGRVLAGRFAIAIIMVVFSGSLACSVLLRNHSWPSVFANGTISIKTRIARAPEPAPGHLGSQMMTCLLKFLLAGPPEPAPGHLGPHMVHFY